MVVSQAEESPRRLLQAEGRCRRVLPFGFEISAERFCFSLAFLLEW